MSSPVTKLLASFIVIDRESPTPVYRQISNQIINAIQRGYLMTGTKLPGTRTLSGAIDVHRRTGVAVYEELESQGWIEVRPNRGAFVIADTDLPVFVQRGSGPLSFASYPKETGFVFRKSNLLDNPFEYANCEYIWNDGMPDIRLTQIEDLSRVYSANLKRKSNRKKMGYYNQEGSEYFKQNLANYLNYSRGLHISTNNLLITRSTEMSLYIISEILLAKHETVIVGDLSYFSANMIFQKTGARIQSVPVDEEGLDVDAIRSLCECRTIRMVYVSPHHHYPTTVTLSAQRRLELLHLSSVYGFVILEDDPDYDFHYDKSPMLPLASSDTDGMVVYVGSFGKSLAPGFRTGFIVAPENLMSEMRKYLGIIDRQGDIIVEQALGEMIEEGEINRHLKKSVKVYHQRRDNCVALLQKHLSDVVRFEAPSGGLAIWIVWKKHVNLLELSNQCAKQNLFIPKTLLYQNRQLSGIRLGFGHLNEMEMEHSMLILRDAYKT